MSLSEILRSSGVRVCVVSFDVDWKFILLWNMAVHCFGVGLVVSMLYSIFGECVLIGEWYVQGK